MHELEYKFGLNNCPMADVSIPSEVARHLCTVLFPGCRCDPKQMGFFTEKGTSCVSTKTEFHFSCKQGSKILGTAGSWMLLEELLIRF